MKAMAISLLGLYSCATVQPAIPSSLPFIHIDPGLSGAVASESAGKVFLKRLRRCESEAADRETEMRKDNRVCSMKLAGAQRFIEKNAWWSQHGLTVAVVSGAGGAFLSALVFLLVFLGGFGGK